MTSLSLRGLPRLSLSFPDRCCFIGIPWRKKSQLCKTQLSISFINLADNCPQEHLNTWQLYTIDFCSSICTDYQRWIKKLFEIITSILWDSIISCTVLFYWKQPERPIIAWVVMDSITWYLQILESMRCVYDSCVCLNSYDIQMGTNKYQIEFKQIYRIK